MKKLLLLFLLLWDMPSLYSMQDKERKYQNMMATIPTIAQEYKQLCLASNKQLPLRYWFTNKYANACKDGDTTDFDVAKLIDFLKKLGPDHCLNYAFKYSKDGRYFAYYTSPYLKENARKYCLYDAWQQEIRLVEGDEKVPEEVRVFDNGHLHSYWSDLTKKSYDGKFVVDRKDNDWKYVIKNVATEEIVSDPYNAIYFDPYRPRVILLQANEEKQEKMVILCTHHNGIFKCEKILTEQLTRGNFYFYYWMFSPISQRYIVAGNEDDDFTKRLYEIYDMQEGKKIQGSQIGKDHYYSHCEMVGDGNVVFYRNVSDGNLETVGYLYDLQRKKMLFTTGDYKEKECISLWVAGSQLFVVWQVPGVIVRAWVKDLINPNVSYYKKLDKPCATKEEVRQLFGEGVETVEREYLYKPEVYTFEGGLLHKEAISLHEAYTAWARRECSFGDPWPHHAAALSRLYCMAQPGYRLNIIENLVRQELAK